jgi:TPR repeat protein
MTVLTMLLLATLGATSENAVFCATPPEGATQELILAECEAAAANGDAYAQQIVGTAYIAGFLRERDPARAASLFSKCAEQGVPECASALGTLYEKGDGVERDPAKAFELYRQSAEGGFREGQYNLASLYARGEGVQQDKALAIRWYKASAESGYARAKYNLAIIYTFGDGTAIDKDEANRLFMSAAEDGLKEAQRNVGIMHFNLREFDQAVTWLQMAADQGDAEAVRLLEIAKRYASPAPGP